MLDRGFAERLNCLPNPLKLCKIYAEIEINSEKCDKVSIKKLLNRMVRRLL